MKKNKLHFQAFTMIEIIISITILSIIMISVLQIFIHSTEVTAKSDINRIMQENIKNVVSHIAEDVRKNGIIGVSQNYLDTCDMVDKVQSGSKLCLKSLNNYFLYKNNTRVESSDCIGIKDNCSIVMDGVQLTNSFVAVKDLEFIVTNDIVPKVTINIIMQPAIGKGVKSNLIKESKLIFQTTISERPF